MAPKPIPQQTEHFRAPDRTSRPLIRLGPAANDNRRPKRPGQYHIIWPALAGLAAATVMVAFFI